jgi:hypothetical protein
VFILHNEIFSAVNDIFVFNKHDGIRFLSFEVLIERNRDNHSFIVQTTVKLNRSATENNPFTMSQSFEKQETSTIAINDERLIAYWFKKVTAIAIMKLFDCNEVVEIALKTELGESSPQGTDFMNLVFAKYEAVEEFQKKHIEASESFLIERVKI